MVVSHSQFCTGRSPGLSCIGVLLGNGDGSFQPAVTYESGGTGAWSLAAADFNGDGKVDVAVAHQCRPLTCQGATAIVGVIDGNGDGSFQSPLIYDTDAPSVLFPKPVYFSRVRKEGQPFTETDPVYGKVYHLGSSEDLQRLLEAENGYWYTSHPRTKSSGGNRTCTGTSLLPRATPSWDSTSLRRWGRICRRSG
jgi:hypothetical protein